MPAIVAPIVTAVKAAGIMKSLAVAGTALSAVGAVTKNEKLMKIGAIAGGIGTLGSIGVFGQGIKTLGMSEAAKSAALSTAARGGSAAGASYASQALDRSFGPLTQGYTPAPGGPSGLLASRLNDAAQLNLQTKAPSLISKIGGAMQTGVGLIKDNPELANILAAGGSELANYLSGATEAELDRVRSQINVNDANAQSVLAAIDDEKRRRRNLNQGYLTVNPVLSLPGQVNPYQPPTVQGPTVQGPGLLSQNMVGAGA